MSATVQPSAHPDRRLNWNFEQDSRTERRELLAKAEEFEDDIFAKKTGKIKNYIHLEDSGRASTKLWN